MNIRKTARSVLPWAGAVCTGLMLACAFAPLEVDGLAWVAFIPLIIAARGASPRRGFALGYTAGCVFWLFSLHWLTHVTTAGWIALALYCALYTGPTGLLCAWWFKRFGMRGTAANLALMAFCALGWAGLEFVRSTLFTGFPWNPLAVSQYGNLTVLQLARWSGAYGVSAVIVWVNCALALTVLRYADARGRAIRRWHPELMAGLLVWALVHADGYRQLMRGEQQGTPVQIALIQPNIPQVEKWTVEHIDTIYDRLQTLTEAAMHLPDVDLAVWPETALPDEVRTSPESYDLVYRLVTNGVPLLVGSMDTMWRDDGEPVYFNSSFLFNTTGSIVQGYDKQHLVLFGEYVPFEKQLPFMSAMTPISASFTGGSTGTVFHLEGPDINFGVLICFEDTVAKVARELVRNGIRLIVNQTNDAWFDVSSGSRQHMLHCVLRCIENRVPAVRATNTGVTCAIDRYGRIHDVLEESPGNTLTAGFRVTQVRVPAADGGVTFYTQHGDVAGWGGAAIAAMVLAWGLVVERRHRNNSRLIDGKDPAGGAGCEDTREE